MRYIYIYSGNNGGRTEKGLVRKDPEPRARYESIIDPDILSGKCKMNIFMDV